MDIVNGFSLGFSLILAIGAQNALVLRQGLRREHVFAVCLTCALSDAILIGIGVAGFGSLVKLVPGLVPVLQYGGAAFLIWYGLTRFLAAWRGGARLIAAKDDPTPLRQILATLLVFTWLNPHVYLDTVVLIGANAALAENSSFFGIGAIIASFVFFFLLGYGARLLGPVFENSRNWQVFEAAIGVVMWALAAKLILDRGLNVPA
jgi:L-lysine exporter family protein LysE/ArgO